MNKLKIFLTTFALCIMSVGFSFADSSNSIRHLAPNGNDYKYKIEYKIGSTYTMYTDYEPNIKTDVKQIHLTGHTMIYIDGHLYNSFNSGYLSYVDLISVEGPLVDPPQIAPTIQGAIQGIVPTFSNQLLQYLPKVLIMFSMVLLVPLVPRVIRYFF